MNLTSTTFAADQPIPDSSGFGKPDPETRFTFSSNRNPQLAWSDVPEGCKSFVLFCIDRDVPTKPDDVNQEGRTVPASLPRTEFTHWVMVDIPASCTSIDEAACSSEVTPGGKSAPDGPGEARQGVNDFTAWFAGDENMGGTYLGYDGPAPPWNDEIIHHYTFTVCATDLDRCPVEGDFTTADVRAAIEGHVLAEASITGTYTMNPDLR